MNIVEYGRKFDNMLTECRYAGDVHIEQEEVEHLALEFTNSSNELNKFSNLYNAMILVLAVNCAYHYYDDDGFWIHFTNLMRIPNEYYHQSVYGETIEKALKQYNLFRTQRSGAYRYVGAILEQTGITKRYFKKYAEIFSELKHKFGCELLASMPQNLYKKTISYYSCPKYLESYLLDEAGWKFTRHVATLIALYENGEIDKAELLMFKGFRPEFWETLIDNVRLATSTSSGKRAQGYVKNLMFDCEINKPVYKLYCQHAEAMDDIDILSKQYGIASICPKNFMIQYSSKSVRAKEEGIICYRFNCWVPDGKPVLFDLMTGMVRHGSTIRPGTYYLLSQDKEPAHVIDDYGEVNINSGSYRYRSYKIRLTEGVSVLGYMVKKDADTSFVVSWSNKEMYLSEYCFSTEFDIFSGGIPDIYISDWNAIYDGSVYIGYVIGDKFGRITCQEDFAALQDMAAALAPVYGEITCRITSRSDMFFYGLFRPDFKFFVMQEKCLLVDKKWYAIDEPVELLIKSCGQADIIFDSTVNSTKTDKGFSLRGSFDTIQGKYKFENIDFDIRIPIGRAAVCFTNGEKLFSLKYLCIDDETLPDIVYFKGPRGKIADLFAGKIKILECEFDSRGICQIDKAQLIDAFDNTNSDVSELRLVFEATDASIGAYIMCFNTLIKKSCTSGRIDFDSKTPYNINGIVQLLSAVSGRTQIIYIIENFVSLTKYIDKRVSEVLACAEVFDKVVFQIDGDTVSFLERLSSNELYTYLKCIAAGTGYNGCLEPPAIPPVPRWINETVRIKNLQSYKPSKEVDEWSLNIVKGSGYHLNQLHRRIGGDVISASWLDYYNLRYDDAIIKVGRLSSTDGLINDLKAILYTMLLFKRNRFSSSSALLKDYESNVLKDIIGFLAAISELLLTDGSKCIKTLVPPDEIFKLPFNRQDQRLFRFLKEDNGKDFNIHEFEWFGLWLIAENPLIDKPKRRICIEELYSKSLVIPPSPEHSAVTINKIIDIRERML